ncbi:hypothetical protein N1031_13015 [Herbiconiux moechotypicola]|uniref:DNA modification methylase n=1 Tax=Herbiconiux moechotypicola TaxID=637393 RepID=A0ABN3DRL0_9MICO|nr:hypothetical protein [Herbiconiux moechotypicola]MCS5730685.1 hypothetical protein [Herbiconiux moechotypicola]
MRARFAASVLVLALVGAGTAGCAFITPQATTKEVEASDGVNADLGAVAVRNATLITEDGALASLLVSFVNTSDTTQDVTVQYEDGSTGERVSQSVPVEGNGDITSFGATGAEQILLENVSAPGSLFPVYFQYGDEEGKLVSVPVLTTSLPEYADLAPTPTPTVVVTPEPVVVTPAPTPEVVEPGE